MSDMYLIKGETLTAIADAIREKAPNNYGGAPVTPEDMYEEAIYNVWQEGRDVGYSEGKSDITLQDKTVTPTTNKQTVTAGSDYDGLGTVTVNAMPTATQATPSISIDANGKISASATQSAGYVSAGTKTSTKQMTVQAAKTITPSTTSQTAVAKNVYTTGAVTVAGDSNLKAENIKSGTSIFGVTGTYEGTGASGGASGVEYEIITIYAGATSATYTLPRVTNAYGSITSFFDVNTDDEWYGSVVSVDDNMMHFVYLLESTPIGAEFATDSAQIYYNRGTITWDDSLIISDDINVLLVNDPSKDVLSTCTPT